MLTYGPHADLAKRFLISLYAHVDPALFQLRAGLNEVEARTRYLFDHYAARFGNVQLFVEPRNQFKSPLMRRLFHEPPIATEWTIWCDDDTHFAKSDWLQRLSFRMEEQPQTDMWGMLHKLWRHDAFIQHWIEAAPWYRGLPLRRGIDPGGIEATEFQFATGGFWAVRTRIIHQLNWPDPRLIQANDDFLLGEAMRQNGHPVGNFYYGVNINDAPRRNSNAAEVCELFG
jgi:hypothetical protein